MHPSACTSSLRDQGLSSCTMMYCRCCLGHQVKNLAPFSRHLEIAHAHFERFSQQQEKTKFITYKRTSFKMNLFLKKYCSNTLFDFSPGSRNQPLVQLQRKSLQLPPSSNYTALSASLTTARTQYEIGGFPFLLGLETNSSG